MFPIQKLWIKKHKKHLILILLLLALTNLITASIASRIWQSKVLQVANNCQETKSQHKKIVAFNVKIPIKKVFIQI